MLCRSCDAHKLVYGVSSAHTIEPFDVLVYCVFGDIPSSCHGNASIEREWMPSE